MWIERTLRREIPSKFPIIVMIVTEMRIITKPITAKVTALRADCRALGSPTDRIIRIPPMIMSITVTTPAMAIRKVIILMMSVGSW